MNQTIVGLIAKLLNINERSIANTIQLLEDGATIPFISRYRKELTGALDEVQIADINNEYHKLTELIKRKEHILEVIQEQGKLTDELRQTIENCWQNNLLEDIYLPYKPKRRTRAQIAREKGLEPLAKRIMQQNNENPQQLAALFVKDQVASADEALSGARDIIAEWVNESSVARQALRAIFAREAIISSRVIKGKETEGDKYRDYFEMDEPLRRIASHRLLAMRRGEAEKVLRIDISPDEDNALERLDKIFLKADNEMAAQVADAITDSYKRLLKPSLETEFAATSKEKADAEAIRMFAENLRQLLLSSPLGQKRILAIDPGFRTGCKVVCLSAQGELLHNEAIFPHPPQSDTANAARKVARLVEQYQIEAIAIGNGTAGRETEQFIQNIRFDREVKVFSVSESGASIYSASKIARDEFPEYDVTVRGAVSIGRRLMDPLAELVKIDAKSIGVGQYQHDVDQPKLKESLDQVVESCVNSVGVNLNTAGKQLLTYVSGLGPQLAQNIVDFRAENGAFTSRKQLLKVPKLGAKTFEQCAGFLRIDQAKNPLDNSAVHPERYALVERMAKDLKCTVEQLIKEPQLREQIDLEQYLSDSVGMHTLKDIIKELEKPGRDPRTTVTAFEFDPNIRTIDDLRSGMELNGIVTNMTNFGAFVDIGIKENGLVHISQMADRFVSNPAEVVHLNQQVRVKVLEVDTARKRVQLTMKL